MWCFCVNLWSKFAWWSWLDMFLSWKQGKAVCICSFLLTETYCWKSCCESVLCWYTQSAVFNSDLYWIYFSEQFGIFMSLKMNNITFLFFFFLYSCVNQTRWASWTGRAPGRNSVWAHWQVSFLSLWQETR